MGSDGRGALELYNLSGGSLFFDGLDWHARVGLVLRLRIAVS